MGQPVTFNQYDLCIVDLNPTRGSEMQKVRPCVILSPSDANRYLNTVVVAPITSKIRRYKFRAQVHAGTVDGEIAFDHIRSIDKSRITKTISSLDAQTIAHVKSVLREFLLD